jgi:tRNA pseudouridine55 synthase
VDGILIIDKPEGLTSHDVVARVRRILKTKRVGHTGTLDPFATGVLVLLVGQATRLAQFLDKDEKEYEALVRLGYETDTGDRTGSTRGEMPDPNSEILISDSESQISNLRFEIPNGISRQQIEDVLAEFRGVIEQVPPMYSAKKVEGKKLYELARQGIDVERKPVRIEIKTLEMLPSDESRDLHSTFRIRVVCSAGTYIRTLAEGIGRKLGVGAHLQELRRTRAGRFALSRSITIEKLGALDAPSSALIPLPEAVSHLPEIVLPPARVDKTRNGLSSRSDEVLPPNQPVRMVDESNNLIAIGLYDEAENSVRPKIVLV